MSVRQAQREISSAEFSEWVAYHAINPFTIQRVENMLAIIASLIQNSMKKKNAKSFKPADFIPQYGKRTVETGQQLEIKMRALLGGNNK